MIFEYMDDVKRCVLGCFLLEGLATVERNRPRLTKADFGSSQWADPYAALMTFVETPKPYTIEAWAALAGVTSNTVDVLLMAAADVTPQQLQRYIAILRLARQAREAIAS